MVEAKVLSDFALTGCAIVPVMGLAFSQPEFALFSHVVLLLGGLLVAGLEDDAPFKKTQAEWDEVSGERAASGRLGEPLPPRTDDRVANPIHRQSDSRNARPGQSAAERRLK
jgi:hypothetical protein